jgi:hypothetical protein
VTADHAAVAPHARDKRVSCFGRYDRIDDLVLCNLRADKYPLFRQFLEDEFHFSAFFKCFDLLFVWHFRIFSGEIGVLSRVWFTAAPRTGNDKTIKKQV